MDWGIFLIVLFFGWIIIAFINDSRFSKDHKILSKLTIVIVGIAALVIGLAWAEESPRTPTRTRSTTPYIQQSEPSALCRDGTLSYSSNRRGTCSHHGGVSVWY
ncbi:MAG: DUF3761 domain-containing protein [bacterium]|nr:DUF3761 domain-containing protein [bacterium]